MSCCEYKLENLAACVSCDIYLNCENCKSESTRLQSCKHTCKMKVRFLGDTEVPRLCGKNTSSRFWRSWIGKWYG